MGTRRPSKLAGRGEMKPAARRIIQLENAVRTLAGLVECRGRFADTGDICGVTYQCEVCRAKAELRTAGVNL